MKKADDRGRMYLERGDVLVNGAGDEVKYVPGKAFLAKFLGKKDVDFRVRVNGKSSGQLLDVYYDLEDGKTKNHLFTRPELLRKKGAPGNGPVYRPRRVSVPPVK